MASKYREFLKEYRLELEISKCKVCRETGLSRNTLTSIEEGRIKNPRISNISKLAHFYGLTLREVFNCAPDQGNEAINKRQEYAF